MYSLRRARSFPGADGPSKFECSVCKSKLVPLFPIYHVKALLYKCIRCRFPSIEESDEEFVTQIK